MGYKAAEATISNKCWMFIHMLRTMMETHMAFNHLYKMKFLVLKRQNIFLTVLKSKPFWDKSDLRYMVGLRFFSKTAMWSDARDDAPSHDCLHLLEASLARCPVTATDDVHAAMLLQLVSVRTARLLKDTPQGTFLRHFVDIIVNLEAPQWLYVRQG
jgi:hypothetical protein